MMEERKEEHELRDKICCPSNEDSAESTSAHTHTQISTTVHDRYIYYHNMLLSCVRTFVQWLCIYFPRSEHEELTKIGDLSDSVLKEERQECYK